MLYTRPTRERLPSCRAPPTNSVGVVQTRNCCCVFHDQQFILLTPAARREADSLQHTIQEKNGEIRQLQKQLSDVERDKHTELVKLRLEVSSLWTISPVGGAHTTN